VRCYPLPLTPSSGGCKPVHRSSVTTGIYRNLRAQLRTCRWHRPPVLADRESCAQIET